MKINELEIKLEGGKTQLARIMCGFSPYINIPCLDIIGEVFKGNQHLVKNAEKVDSSTMYLEELQLAMEAEKAEKEEETAEKGETEEEKEKEEEEKKAE